MARLKRTEKLDKMVTNFVKKFGCEAELGSEFCYWHGEDLINYSLVVPCDTDDFWKEFVYRTFNYKIENIFMFSLLHEVGHHFTMDNFSKKQRNAENRMTEEIESKLSISTSKTVDKGLNFKYFNMPMEKVATKWAIRYYKKHRREINHFWHKFRKELKKFYQANNVK